MTGHGNRAASASAGVALAALLLTACVSEVRLAPDDPSWTVAGGVATWTAEPVTVVVHLDTDVVDFPARGEIVNRGAAPVRVTFVPAADTAEGGAGRMGGTAEGLPSPLSAGTPYDVP